MKIQARILIMLATVSLLALAVLVGVLLTVVAPAFEQLDQEQATKNINRVKQSLANELAVLDQKVVDWAHWNDTYAFVLDASPDYIAANLQSSSLTNLNVSFMAFFDPGGKPVWAGGYDAANEEAKDFAALADPAQTRALTTGRQRSVHGLLVMDGRNYLISAGDILDSDGNGPSHGTLAIGREIDEALLGDLKSRTEVNFRTEPHELGRSNAAPDGPILVAETAELLTHRITLRDVNDIPPRMLVKAGSTLLVPRSPHRQADVSEHLAENAMIALAPEGRAMRRVALKAGKRDSVASVAKRYRVSAAQVAQWNDVGAGASFRPGQSIIVYVAQKAPQGTATRSVARKSAAAKTVVHKPARKSTGAAGKTAKRAKKR